jgi:hypothetical protein
MAVERLKLYCCLVLDDPVIFSIQIASSEDVGALKQEIKKRKAKRLVDIDPDYINLWKVSRVYAAALRWIIIGFLL